ncbi:tetratricopeptide repeat protein, partial [bacterium]|nr:tetratricopeptide repeat protein [bacterium]
YLQKALDVNPDNYWTYYLLGDFYSANDKYPDSISYYKDSISINPNFAPSYLALGVSYFKTDKYEQSVAALKKYIELNQNSDFAYFMLAKNYYLMGEYSMAKTFIKKAIKINPTNQYRLELAKIEFNNADYQSALLNFQILEPEYQYAELYNYIGLCNLMLKRYELAIINFNKAIVIDSKRPIYYYNLAQCYKALDENKKYVQYMNIANQMVPVTYQDYIDLSCIYYNTGKQNMAVKTLENGIELNQNAKPIYMALMSLYERLGDKVNYSDIKNKIEVRFNSNEQKKAFKLFK